MANPGLSGHSHIPPSLVYILVSLTDVELTREEINKRVTEYSQGLCQLNKGAAHRRITFLKQRGWIKADPGPRSGDDAPRTIYYRLLPAGQLAMRQEVKRLQSVIALGKKQLSAPGPQPPGPESLTAPLSLPRTKRDEQRTKPQDAPLLEKKAMSPAAVAAVLRVPVKAVHR
ncbi:MAG: PadR family transcriptional regulator, partial [Candidatus Angelobacter sp.]